MMAPEDNEPNGLNDCNYADPGDTGYDPDDTDPDPDDIYPDKTEAPGQIPLRTLGNYGNPELWAKSTLAPGVTENLVEIHTIAPGKYVTAETVRHRTWIHEILDDNKVPYKISIVGYWPTRKKFAEQQVVSVEEKNAKKARRLIREYNDPDNLIKGNTTAAETPEAFVEGILQIPCPKCGKPIDFDYTICPKCKSRLV